VSAIGPDRQAAHTVPRPLRCVVALCPCLLPRTCVLCCAQKEIRHLQLQDRRLQEGMAEAARHEEAMALELKSCLDQLTR
jgi:hypothetical protein